MKLMALLRGLLHRLVRRLRRRDWMRPRNDDDVQVIPMLDENWQWKDREISLRYSRARDLFGSHKAAISALEECEQGHLAGDCELCGGE